MFTEALGRFRSKRRTVIFFNPIEILFQFILFYVFQTLF